MQRIISSFFLVLALVCASAVHAQGVRVEVPQPHGYGLELACQRLKPVLVVSPQACLDGAITLNYGTGRAAKKNANNVQVGQPITYPGIRPGTTVAALERLGFKSPVIDGTGTAVTAASREPAPPQAATPTEETSPGWQFVYNELTKDEGWFDEKFGGLTKGQTNIASSVEGVRADLGANNVLLKDALVHLQPLVTIGQWLNDPRPNFWPVTVYDYAIYAVVLATLAYAFIWRALPIMVAFGGRLREWNEQQHAGEIPHATDGSGSEPPPLKRAMRNVDARFEGEPYTGTYEDPDEPHYQTDRTAA